MTKPLHVTRAQAKRLERNLGRGQGTAKKKGEVPRRVTIHLPPNVKPETLAALAALALHVMKMPEKDLTEFLKKMRRK